LATSAWCIRKTLIVASALSANPAKGPMRPAVRALVA
jgi:hypothetical protein